MSTKRQERDDEVAALEGADIDDDGEDSGTSLSRRHFLGVAAGVAAGVGIVPPLAAAAARRLSVVEAGPWATAPVTFVFLDTQEPDHLDPAYGILFDEFHIHRELYEPLVDTDEANARLVPALARAWKASPDGTTHTFFLRPGVLFHDGSKFDADVVKMNIARYQGIGQGESYLIKNIKKVIVKDPLTVQIVTDGPDPWLPSHLVKFGMVSGAVLTSGKTTKDQWSTAAVEKNPIGTGPYVFEEWQKGVQVSMTKNTKWWGRWQPGSIDKVIIKPVADASQRVQLIVHGDADFTTEWAIRDALDTGKKPGFVLRDFKTYDTNPIIDMNTEKPPFDKKEVRQAVQWAFDYKAMRDFFQGSAEVTTGPLPPDYPGGARDLPVFKQDMGKAKALLQKAGVDPSSVTLDFPAAAGYADLQAGASIMQASLQQLGMKVNIKAIPFGQITTAYGKPETAGHITDLYNSPFTLDPTQFLVAFIPGNFANTFMKYDNAQVNAMFKKIGTAQNATLRNKLLHDVQHQIVDDAPCVFGGRPHTLVAHRTYVTGYQMQFTDYRFPCRFHQLRIKAH